MILHFETVLIVLVAKTYLVNAVRVTGVKVLFTEVSDHASPVFEVELYNLTTSQCTRICRMYAECYAFNMVWSTTDRGLCQVMTGYRSQHMGELRSEIGTFYFCKCLTEPLSKVDHSKWFTSAKPSIHQ